MLQVYAAPQAVAAHYVCIRGANVRARFHSLPLSFSLCLSVGVTLM